MSERVTFTRESDRPHVGHLRIDADDHNLLTPALVGDIREAVASVPDDCSVLTVVGRPGPDGAVSGLTAGLHLGEASDLSSSEARHLIGDLRDAIRAVRDLDAVTVCSCGGYALGAGLELAMACDFRVATTDAVLGLPEVEVGLVTGIQGGLLIRLVGLQAAKELVFLGDPVSGERAESMGLVNRAVSPDEYDDAVAGIVDGLAEKSPLVLRWQSEVFRAWRCRGVEAGVDHSRETIAACFDTHDQREGMTAFLEGRAPAFEGR
ncbi:enoyl-CoA hydratase/isomerase family protein [Halomarina litorea]|uniref:enoyl-CoA hydratase/isomerase family protein n=1 Tax=Halomarina litorea TaxID=2961595 RepID=UPI0020C2A8CF|nr:enoyl-CoA hydratase-related protein [Halomarina sp. BCD28]